MEPPVTPTSSGRRTAATAAALISRLGQSSQNQRRLSAYKFFMKEVLAELRNQYPGGSIVLPVVSRLCAQRWLRLDPRIKQRFQDSVDVFENARRNPDQQPAEVDQNTQASTSSSSSGKKIHVAPAPRINKIKGIPATKLPKPPKRKQKVIPGGPKRPLSAFVYFCKKNRQLVKDRNPDLNICEVTQELGKIWNSLDEESRWEYVRTSMVDRNRYSQEMAMFRTKLAMKAEPEEEQEDLIKQSY